MYQANVCLNFLLLQLDQIHVAEQSRSLTFQDLAVSIVRYTKSSVCFCLYSFLFSQALFSIPVTLTTGLMQSGLKFDPPIVCFIILTVFNASIIWVMYKMLQGSWVSKIPYSIYDFIGALNWRGGSNAQSAGIELV